MTLLRSLRHWLACRRLKRMMKPNPAYRQHRLAQFGPERRERYFANVRAVYLGKQGVG